MRALDLAPDAAALPGAVPAWRATLETTDWRMLCERANGHGARLVALWSGAHGNGTVNAALAVKDGLLWAACRTRAGRYPSLVDLYPEAGRMERAATDLSGSTPEGNPDARPWLRHAAWSAGTHPLSPGFAPASSGHQAPGPYPFVRVAGDGVHEIPVGPVHAGTIEPGHFRFSVVGETVLRLEERLGYKHKGIERLFQGRLPEDGARLAGRISGDTTVAYAWAYAQAAEGLADCTPPPRAQWLRALLLERERVANHLGDLGFLGNDAGLAFGLAQFSRLKEDWLRGNAAICGHRYLMDAIVPGGVTMDITPDTAADMRGALGRMRVEVARLRRIFDDHPGLQDRFNGTGRITRELALTLGITGLAARASGRDADLRRDLAPVPYDVLVPKVAVHLGGDVAARVAVRFDEVTESMRLIEAMLDGLPQGACRVATAAARPMAASVGWVEGWRGDVMIAVETDGAGRIARLHPHDPSWQNWPALEHAVLGNIVPDFPLINKSFNLSYSGHDL